jgi:hypothetical protein
LDVLTGQRDLGGATRFSRLSRPQRGPSACQLRHYRTRSNAGRNS